MTWYANGQLLYDSLHPTGVSDIRRARAGLHLFLAASALSFLPPGNEEATAPKPKLETLSSLCPPFHSGAGRRHGNRNIFPFSRGGFGFVVWRPQGVFPFSFDKSKSISLSHGTQPKSSSRSGPRVESFRFWFSADTDINNKPTNICLFCNQHLFLFFLTHFQVRSYFCPPLRRCNLT